MLSACAFCRASPCMCVGWNRPDSLVERCQRQLAIVCSGYCVHAHPTQNAHPISLILEKMALIAQYDLQSNAQWSPGSTRLSS